MYGLSVVLLGLSLVLFLRFCWTRKESMKIFKQINVPGPPPNFLFGNLISFAKKQAFYSTYLDWYKIYGKTFGYFEGLRPVLVTADLDVLNQVMVKKFDIFHARKVFPVQVDPDKDDEVHMFFARGDRWKRLRAISNPAFTSAKIRKMSSLVHNCIDNVIAELKRRAHNNESIEMYDIFQRLTLDSMSSCGFGFNTSAIQNPNDVFLKNCRQVLYNTTRPNLFFLIGFLFPSTDKFLVRLARLRDYIFGNPVFWLEKQFEKIIAMRKKFDSVPRMDLLHMMIEANKLTHSEESLHVPETPTQNIPESKYKYAKLSLLELRSQCFLFLMAGYETTATTLIYTAYELAYNQEIQSKLYDEIIECFPNKDDEITYDIVNKMEYLDKVWCETLRKYPLASTVVARQAEKSCKLSEDLTIPKGMIVQANIWAIHYNPDVWGADPHKFNPERFIPELVACRHPMAYLAFGAGPRKCIGIQFAKMEGKIAIVKLVQTFHMILSEKQGPLETIEGATIAPVNGVYLRLSQRY
ncbi:cytochrome P450 3A24 isoform X1 [Octopus bimaculoides]|nr:cytochrome P450 3A24 isoform X1 [Octopus bimaculoides]